MSHNIVLWKIRKREWGVFKREVVETETTPNYGDERVAPRPFNIFGCFCYVGYHFHVSLGIPYFKESEIVAVTFTAGEIARLRQFTDCSAALLCTSIVQRGFRTSINVRFADGQLAAEWIMTDDEMFAYLHKYRPFGLKKELTYFYNIVNILSKNVESSLFRSSLRTLRDMFSGKLMQETKLKIELNGVVLNSDDFFMEWLNAYQYHREPAAIENVDALHTILPLGFTEALMMTLMSEKTSAISQVARYAVELAEAPVCQSREIVLFPTP